MAAPLFISYRRDDSHGAAQALYAQLRSYFGLDAVFMDVNTIQPSQPWPERIETALEGAVGLVVMVGPGWLFAHDQFGRRRIDDAKDWVRSEIRRGLKSGKPIYPVTVDTEMPPPGALPADIAELCSRQATRLARDTWLRDVTAFANVLERDGVLAPSHDAPRIRPRPDPVKARRPPLREQELAVALTSLKGWEPTRESLFSEYPHERQELRRNLSFRSFRAAVAFMREAAELFEQEQHHPRWSNEWKVVTIRLTTWDAGNKITMRDVEVASKVDDLVRKFRAQQSPASAGRGGDGAAE